LVNLAVNARDAMPSGGTLTIDTANVRIDEETATAKPGLHAGRFVHLRVSDSGTGMYPEVASRAFEPFFTTKAKGEGSGLGLATVYGIVTQAGGHVEIVSTVDVGTTVSALLPAIEGAVPVVEEVPASGELLGGETILVVEDESAMRELTHRILTRNGYQVISAASGPEALELTATFRDEIHLLLTDVVMPQLLGREVAERICRQRPDVRVLYMSGYAYPVLAQNGTLAPGLALITKPFSERVLLSKVREVLDASPSDRPA
ncbi:response regulator, partial [Frankia sp. EI5c]|uniref:response regulator n=1 Tax=Frankia sp. EI5c TaxID=683316 RepID=UPI001F5B4755